MTSRLPRKLRGYLATWLVNAAITVDLRTVLEVAEDLRRVALQELLLRRDEEFKHKRTRPKPIV